MRIPGVKTVKAFSRWMQARLLGGAIILGYHRVAGVIRDEDEICVSRQHFAEHMEMVRRHTHPVSLNRLIQHLKDGEIPDKSLAITFDDGYVDNLDQAKPVLEKYQIPATVFVCTGYAGKEFWWDELERLVMSSQADVRRLRFQTGESQFEWEQPVVSPAAGGLANISVRRRLRHALYHFLLALDVEERENGMNAVRRWAGLSTWETSNHRAMTHEELLKLADGGLVELGAHTRTHPMLPRLSLERQRQEILSSKEDLEALLGRQIEGFAYPNGQANVDAKRTVKAAGFAFACTSLQNTIRPGHDAYELTRFWQKDVDGEQFLKGMKTWLRI